ncbi:MAG: Cof-type HAD-IIB family hydrolase [Chloroflexota bacterium]
MIPRSPGFPIRMIALDIDGTIVGDDLTLGPRIRSAVRAALDRGIRVSLVTGRMASSAQRFADELGLVDPIVAYQGALIRAMPEERGRLGRLLVHRPLPAAVARETISWSIAHGLDPHVNHLETFVIRADDPRTDDYSAFLGAPARRVPDIGRAVTRPVTKVLAAAEDPRPMRSLENARRTFSGRAAVTVSHPRFLEFVAPGVSKGRAVRWLARRHGVPLEQAMAIGDHLNDLEMILEVGHGAAMPSAPAAVLEAARYLPGPVDAEGAAELIEALALAEPAAARRNALALATR